MMDNNRASTTIRRYGLLIVGLLFLVGAFLVGLAALPALARGPAVPGRTPTPGYGTGSGGMMGGSAGPGGMMGGSAGPGGMMGGSAGPQPTPGTPRISGQQARQAVTAYLNASYAGQNLAIGEILGFQNNFYARIQEPSTGVNALELLIDPYRGTVGPEHGPNMMWNTKYGPMATGAGGRMGGGMMGGGMMGGYTAPNPPTADMPVKAEQALATAQQYLRGQGSPLTVESQPDTFYGYYTFETLQDGQTAGMLSVNGYSGQVWVHTWHGPFLGTVDFGK